MHEPSRSALSKHQLVLVGLVALLACMVKLRIASTTIGTNDVLRWETFLTTLRASGGIGLYQLVGYFNHPPFMIHALFGMDALTSLMGMAFPFWLRVPAIIADLVSLVLVWKLIQPHWNGHQAAIALGLLAAAPPSILISGFHGNTDPVMICFVLLSVYLLDRRGWVWAAGIAFGMSMNIKVVPIIFIPVLLLYLPTFRQQAIFSLCAAATFAVGSVPYLFQEPEFIVRRVFGYDSLYGLWGLSRLLVFGSETTGGLAVLNTVYASTGKYLVLGIIVALAWWMHRYRPKISLFQQCGLTALVFMVFTPGFGVQYLAWLVPWVVGGGVWAALGYYITSGTFLALVYTFWAGEFPWYLADADAPGVGDWTGFVIYFELACWAAVVVVLGLCFKNALSRRISLT